MHCDFCHRPIPRPRTGQRFCRQPKNCRQNWHRLTGEVAAVRQLKSGRWAMSVHTTALPPVKKGTRIRFSNLAVPRPHAA